MVAAIDVSRCSIIALDDGGELIVKASSDLPVNQEIKIDLGKYPEIEKALTTQTPVVLQDNHKDPHIGNHPFRRPRPHPGNPSKSD